MDTIFTLSKELAVLNYHNYALNSTKSAIKAVFLWNDEARLYIISTFTNVIILSIPQARLILYISNPLHLHYMPKDVIRFQKHKE